MIEVILKREIRKLGDRGDVVQVARGFARNYLFPQGLAIPATPANKKQIEQMKAAAMREGAQLKGDAEKSATVLKDVTITISARAGEADQLFGSVTSRQIAEELEKLGYTIDRHKIIVTKPIRMLGEHEVLLHLHRDVEIPLKVQVVAEGRAESAAAESVATETSEEEPPEREET